MEGPCRVEGLRKAEGLREVEGPCGVKPLCEVEGPCGVEPLREVEGPHAFSEADEGSITSRSALRALVWVLGLGRPLSLERIRNGDWTQCLVRA